MYSSLVLARHAGHVLPAAGLDNGGAARRSWPRQAVPALVLFHVVAMFRQIMPYWPLFGFISLIPLLARDWAKALAERPVANRRRLAAVVATLIVLAAVFTAQALGRR